MKKIFNQTFLAAALFFCASLPSNALYCNSPCPDPCTPSRTVCEGSNCTTYCGTSSVYSGVYYSSPGVSFSYSTPNISFSISNEVYGFHNVYPRPIKVTNGFRPIYYKNPPKPIIKPAQKPNIKPVQNPRPALSKPASKPAQKPAPKRA